MPTRSPIPSPPHEALDLGGAHFELLVAAARVMEAQPSNAVGFTVIGTVDGNQLSIRITTKGAKA